MALNGKRFITTKWNERARHYSTGMYQYTYGKQEKNEYQNFK